MCMARSSVGGEGGEGMRIGYGLYQSCGKRGSVRRVCFGCGGVDGEWVGGLDQGLEGCWEGVMSV